MSAPKLAGFPCWKGLKKKTAKKYFKRKQRISGMNTQTLEDVAKLIENGIGKLFSDCDGFNNILAKIVPEYWNVAGGQVLVGFDCVKEDGYNFCHITEKGTYEEIKEYWDAQVKYAEENGDEWNFAKNFKNGILNPDGTFTKNKG